MMSEAISTGREAPVLAILSTLHQRPEARHCPHQPLRKQAVTEFCSKHLGCRFTDLVFRSIVSSRVKKSCRPSVSSVDTTKSTTAAPQPAAHLEEVSVCEIVQVPVVLW